MATIALGDVGTLMNSVSGSPALLSPPLEGLSGSHLIGQIGGAIVCFGRFVNHVVDQVLEFGCHDSIIGAIDRLIQKVNSLSIITVLYFQDLKNYLNYFLTTYILIYL